MEDKKEEVYKLKNINKGEKKALMKFYIGSGMKNSDFVNYYSNELRDYGWEQTYDWVKNINNDIDINDMIEYASLEKQGIIDSDVVIILLPAGRGAHIELGMALALGKKLFLCSKTKEEFDIENTVAFYELPNVIRLVGDEKENLNEIIRLTQTEKNNRESQLIKRK